VDLIRSGKVPDVIRRNAAQGIAPLPLQEKIEILVFLANEEDPELSHKAFGTLQSWESSEIHGVMADSKTPREILQFAAERLSIFREDIREVLFRNPSLPMESRILLLQTIASQAPPPEGAHESQAGTDSEDIASLSTDEYTGDLAGELEAGEQDTRGGDQPADPPSATDLATTEILAKLASGANIDEVIGPTVEPPAEATMRDDELTSRDRETLIQKIGRMTVVEKIKSALSGNMETRALLIRDSNKIVSRAVLQSPKISETEAEGYAAAKNVSDEVLRLIASTRKFRKLYTVIRALVNNPRAPIDVTMPLLIRINEKDLKGLTLNRNVPEVIRSLAIKMIKQREDAGKSKIHGKH
jgi:hypothetical protein